MEQISRIQIILDVTWQTYTSLRSNIYSIFLNYNEKKIYIKYIYKTVIMFHDLPLTVPSWKFIWNKFHSFSKFHSCFNFVKRSWKKYYIPVRGKLSRIFARAENTFAREVGILQF